MKKIILILLLLLTFGAQAQDTARAAAIIDRYVSLTDFSRYKTDSVFCVVSYAIDQSHPEDTMTIYHWYKLPDCARFEVWQGGKLIDGVYTDGGEHRQCFSPSVRQWRTLTPESARSTIEQNDIRGALYNWRNKNAEIAYDGEYTYEGHLVDRIYVTCPGFYDRWYCFERETGLLFWVTEDERLYGDQKIPENKPHIDIRGWHEFIPFRGSLLPSIESYQAGHQKVIIYHNYSYQALPNTIFTEDFLKR